MAGVSQLLEYLKTHNQRIAVATSSMLQNAIKKLKCAGIFEKFGCIVGGDQVDQGKPDPEIYLLAAKKLGVDPKACLALEDSKNGVLSAFGAGMTVVQIPDIIEPDTELLSLGHIIQSSLIDLLDLDFATLNFKVQR